MYELAVLPQHISRNETMPDGTVLAKQPRLPIIQGLPGRQAMQDITHYSLVGVEL